MMTTAPKGSRDPDKLRPKQKDGWGDVRQADRLVARDDDGHRRGKSPADCLRNQRLISCPACLLELRVRVAVIVTCV
jgi:hypothetical protein